MNTKPASVKNKGLLLFAFLLLALNLRSHITSLPPVIADIQSYFHLNTSTAGLLTSIPVLCFAVFTPLASLCISFLTIAGACVSALTGICIGLIIRSLPFLACTFAGTVVLGFSLTIGNIISLMIIAEYFSDRKDMVTGLYIAAMSVGSMITSAASAAVSKVTNWQFGISVWILITFAALALWIYLGRHEPSSAEKATPRSKAVAVRNDLPPVWKRFSVCLLAISFAAHTSIFYGLTAWLPEFLKSSLQMDSSGAGLAASILQIAGIIGSFGIPALALFPLFNRRNQFLVVTISWFLTTAGLILLPRWWILWMVFGGIGSGGGFIVVFGLVMDQAVDLDDNRRLAAFVQAAGYIFAAVSPVVVGFIKQVSGSWFMGFVFLTAMSVVMTVCGVWASLINEHAAAPQTVC